MYTVLWKTPARDRLAGIWLRAKDRKAITDAVEMIDRDLRRNPDVQGESRAVIMRILIESPLGILFEVQEQDRIVNVLKVWKIVRRGGAG